MSETFTYLQQPICGLTGDDYQRVMADLLPVGLAWPRDPETVQQRVIRGLAEEFARVTARDCDLLAEAYPCGAIESLTDWERICGLPDPCIGPLDTIQQRQQAVCAKLASQGGANAQYFIDLAASIGRQISVTEFHPFRVGDHAGDPLNSQDWAFAWQVTIPSPELNVIYFRAGQSAAGEPLATWGDHILECLISEYAPAHTVIIWAYVKTSIWDAGKSIWDDGESVWDVGVGVIQP